jgi:hypothetical protein
MKYPKPVATLQRQGWPRRLQNRLSRHTCPTRVYPKPGRFLNPVALSNIETYPMTCGWTGSPPRSFLLRSRPGTLVTMQPFMKSAQSKLARLQPAGPQAWADQ